jgi:Carboxypeptidase regulatory-like domain
MKLSVVLSMLLLWTQVGVNRDAQAKKGSIEGVVVRLGSGTSLSGARVTLTKQGGAAAAPSVTAALPGAASVAPAAATPPQGARVAAPTPIQIPPVFTNNEGRFSFPDLDDGSYTVQIQANGYVPFTYGQKFTNGPGAPVKVKSGDPVNNLSVTLKPAGNISGQISDNANQPLANVSIRLLRNAYDSTGQRTLQTVGATQTNDRGEYRFYWVTPGRYSILAGKPSTSADPLNEMMLSALGGVTNSNLTTVPIGFAFYPGVKDPAGATIIDLRPGADLTNLNMTMIPRPATFHIRGRLIDSRTGQPPKSGNVSAMPQIPGLSTDDLILDDESLGYNPANGTFDVRNLLPGIYQVTASAQDPNSGNRGSPPVAGPPTRTIGTIQATISDSDINDLVITTVPAVTISGRLRTEGQLPVSSPQGTVRIQVTPVGGAMNSGFAATATSKPDGSFQLQNIPPGEYRIAVNGLGTRGAIFSSSRIGSGQLPFGYSDGVERRKNQGLRERSSISACFVHSSRPHPGPAARS